MEFSRQEYWSGLPFPSPGDLPDPGIEQGSPALQADSLPSESTRKPLTCSWLKIFIPSFQINMCDLYLATNKLEEEARQSRINFELDDGDGNPVSELCWQHVAWGQASTLRVSVFSFVKCKVDWWPSNVMIAWATFSLFAEINGKEALMEIWKPRSWVPAFPHKLGDLQQIP